MDRFDTYLGLPTLVGRAKYQTFAYLKEQVWKKLQGWKGRTFSRAGKEVLIKVVAQSIPTYTMGVFLFPTKLYDELDALCARFWWGRLVMNGKSIGRVGVFLHNQRRWVVWDSEILGALT